MSSGTELELHILEQTLLLVEQQIEKLEADETIETDVMKQGWLSGWKRSKKEYEDKIDALFLASKFVVLDTETTGLEDTDQIIEIAIVDYNGNTIMNTRLNPSVDIDPGAQSVHGISIDDLHGLPQYPDIEAELRAALEGKSIIIFNSSFDIRMLRQTALAFNRSVKWLEDPSTYCAMRQAVKKYGATNRYGTISLSNAVIRSKCGWHGEAHSALGDALTTLELWKKMEGQ